MYVVNAVSINMLPGKCTVRFTPISIEEAKQLAVESAIGHPSTAAIVSRMLGVSLPPNRIDIKLNPGDRILVAQYTGPRLPEGTTELPEGARIEFWIAEVCEYE